MPYTPVPFTATEGISPEVLEVIDHFNNELQEVARSQQEQDALELRTRNVEPENPRDGMVVHADGTDWDPGSGEGSYVYENGGWTFLGSQGLAAYTSVTDGTTTAEPEATGSALKFREGTGIDVTVGSDDVTHGDNVLVELDLSELSLETVIALADLLVLDKTGNKRMTAENVLKAVGLWTALTGANADRTNDSFAVWDNSDAVGKLVALGELLGFQELATATTTSGETFDFSSISGDYSMLMVVASGVSGGTGGTNLGFQASNDGGVGFEPINSRWLTWTGTTPTVESPSSAVTTGVQILRSLGNTLAASGVMFFPLYASDLANKPFISFWAADNANVHAGFAFGFINSTSPLNLLRFDNEVGGTAQFDAGDWRLLAI